MGIRTVTINFMAVHHTFFEITPQIHLDKKWLKTRFATLVYGNISYALQRTIDIVWPLFAFELLRGANRL